jgi:hypothetical protein
MEKGPKWTPATKGGKRISAQQKVSISFIVPNNKNNEKLKENADAKSNGIYKIINGTSCIVS